MFYFCAKRKGKSDSGDSPKHGNGQLKLILELELELIQTHMTQKPMLRVEVGALGARQVKN